jgi:hypothetical protein
MASVRSQRGGGWSAESIGSMSTPSRCCERREPVEVGRWTRASPALVEQRRRPGPATTAAGEVAVAGRTRVARTPSFNHHARADDRGVRFDSGLAIAQNTCIFPFLDASAISRDAILSSTCNLRYEQAVRETADSTRCWLQYAASSGHMLLHQ